MQCSYFPASPYLQYIPSPPFNKQFVEGTSYWHSPQGPLPDSKTILACYIFVWWCLVQNWYYLLVCNDLPQDLEVKTTNMYYLLVYLSHAFGLSLAGCLCFKDSQEFRVKLAFWNVVASENSPAVGCTFRSAHVAVIWELISYHLFTSSIFHLLGPTW